MSSVAGIGQLGRCEPVKGANNGGDERVSTEPVLGWRGIFVCARWRVRYLPVLDRRRPVILHNLSFCESAPLARVAAV
jgi:hypothetical protein